MKIEAARESATDEHRRKCAGKCERLEEQHGDLKKCLESLVAELQSGARQCKLYRQFKMYNDASLNPQLYKNRSSGSIWWGKRPREPKSQRFQADSGSRGRSPHQL